jgi:2,3-dihydroxyphenylpropionate 1,2-dioxygenase
VQTTGAAPFTAVLDGHAIDDEGGSAGPLDIPLDQANTLVRDVATHNVDIATARHHTIDHGISQALQQLTGATNSVPVIPIIINCVANPLPSFDRCRALGAAVGQHLQNSKLRTLIIGSGGLSHEVTILFPQIDASGNPEHDAYLIDGPTSPLGISGWTEHIRELTHLGNQMLNDGTISSPTRPDLDRAFLDAIQADNFEQLQSLETPINSEGGSGMAEVRTWIAATTAQRTATDRAISIDAYINHPTMGLGYAAAHG